PAVVDFTVDRLAPALRPVRVYVLTTGIARDDDAVMDALRAGGHLPTRGALLTEFEGNQADLTDYDAVVAMGSQLIALAGNHIPDAGAAALIDFVSNGGGLVTGEWWTRHLASFPEHPLADLTPVIGSTVSFANTFVTYTAVVHDDVIDREVPASF